MAIKLRFYDYSFVYIDCNDSLFYEIKEHFSYYAENFQNNAKFKYGTWNGKISLVGKDRLMPLGLVGALTKYAINHDIAIEIHPAINSKYEMSRRDFDEWIDSYKYYSSNDEIMPYWYQLESVYQSLINKRRILNLPTSAGKSLIQALLTKYVVEKSEMNVLIIVPTTALVDQMKNDFVDYRLFKPNEIGQLMTKRDQKNERVVVATWQSAIKKPPEWFDQFGMLLCDEMHLAIGKSITTIINNLRKCEYKIGLSGSLRDGKANLMQYVGLFGDIYSPVTTSELMEAGQVSKLQINCLFLKYPDEICEKLGELNYPSEIKVITQSEKRLEFVCKLSMRLSANNENSFVMFKHIEHGKRIYDRLKALGAKKVYYVSGEIDTETRTKLKHIAETELGVIIIASYGVFSTGISVKNLHHVIFAHPIKSKVIVLQTVGRVLRKHQSKDLAQIWDLIDDMSITKMVAGLPKRYNINYALRHAIDRIDRYGKERFDYIIRKIDLFK